MPDGTTMVQPRIALGSAVEFQLTHRPEMGRVEGVVIELVRPGRTPRNVVHGGPWPKRVPRYVVQHAGGRVLREEHQLWIIAP